MIKDLKGHTDFVSSVAFSPDGKQIVSGSKDKSVRIWNTLTGDMIKDLKGHTDFVRSVAFSIDGKQVVSGSNDISVRIWSISTEDKDYKEHTNNEWPVACFSEEKTQESCSNVSLWSFDAST
ncbi:hypothetical protein H0H92_003049, partial [Tricholoma furcatifolium]